MSPSAHVLTAVVRHSRVRSLGPNVVVIKLLLGKSPSFAT